MTANASPRDASAYRALDTEARAYAESRVQRNRYTALDVRQPGCDVEKVDQRFICGVDQFDPQLVVSCPLAPDLAFVVYQTLDSLKAVLSERHDVDRSQRQPETFGTHVDMGSLPVEEVKRLNHICVSNAHQNVYANYCDKGLIKFLQNRFFGAPAPVRRRDLQPIGSPVNRAHVVDSQT